MDYSIKDIKEIDRSFKPGGSAYEDEAIKRAELYEDQAKHLTLSHLKATGQGDPDLKEPLTTGAPMTARIIEEMATLYQSPMTRRLVDPSGLELPDTHPDQVAMGEVLEACQYDLAGQCVDEQRTVHRQIVLSFGEGVDSVAVRIFEPFNFFRVPDVNLGADTIKADKAVALQIKGSSDGDDAGNEYQVWEQRGTVRAPDWRCFIVDESGRMVGEQPYGETGETPFHVAPFLLVYDEFPRGRAYLKSRQSMISSPLAVNTALNELEYVKKYQAHSQIVSEGDDQRGIGEAGPSKVWQVPSDHRIYPLKFDAPLDEASKTLDHHLRLWCGSVGLPADRFLVSRTIQTGPAAKVAERPITRRRERQLALSIKYEREAYGILRAIHNPMVREGLWSLPELREDTTLRISYTRQDAIQDPREYQEVAFKDLAIGAMDLLEYVMHRRGCSRDEARRYLAQARASAEEFPMRQNPASMTEGPGAAGVDSEKVRGEFHPEVAASVEDNSTTGAVVSALEVPGADA